MRIVATIDTRAINDVLTKLQNAGAKMTKKTAVKAARAALKLPLTLARNIVPVRGGALKRSLTTVVRVYYDGKRAMIWGGLGIKSRYNETAPAGVKTKTGKVRPPLYGHLVELGHGGRKRDTLHAIAPLNSNSFVANKYDKTYTAFRTGDVFSGTKYANHYAKAKRDMKKNLISEAQSWVKSEGFLRPALRNTAQSMVTTFASVIESDLADVFDGKAVGNV